MLCWLFVLVILFILLITLSPGNDNILYESSHSQEFKMILSDEGDQMYVPEKTNDDTVVFRPVEYSTNTTAPQRVDRRYSSPPTDVRSSPPSAYVRSF